METLNPLAPSCRKACRCYACIRASPTDLHCACLRINGSMNSRQPTALISKALNFTVNFVSRTMKDCSLDFQEELGR
jgi:hypothetical protein